MKMDSVDIQHILSQAENKIVDSDDHSFDEKERFALYTSSRRSFLTAQSSSQSFNVAHELPHEISFVHFLAELGHVLENNENGRYLKVSDILVSFAGSLELLDGSVDGVESFLELFSATSNISQSGRLTLLQEGGFGVFKISSFLLDAARDCSQVSGRTSTLQEKRRWEVPFVYILCRLLFDILYVGESPSFRPDAPTLLSAISNCIDSLFHVTKNSRDAGFALWAFDTLLFSRIRPCLYPDGLTVSLVFDILRANEYVCIKLCLFPPKFMH